MEWFEQLGYYFATQWRDAGGPTVPEALYRGIQKRLGAEYAPDALHPVDLAEGGISFIALDGDALHLFRFDPPSTTNIWFLGSLTGGTYIEIVRAQKDGAIETVASFAHERLRAGGVNEIRVAEPTQREGAAWLGEAGSLAGAEVILAKFREWATAPPQQHRA